MKNISIKYLLIGLLPLMGIVACSSTKKMAGTSTINGIQTTTSVQQPAIQLPQFTSMTAGKCKLTLSFHEKTFTVSSSVKIITDSLIQISIMPLLGIEMYRAEFRPDSVTIIDKNNHNYFVTDYKFFKQRFGVSISFSDVQALLSNHTLPSGSGDPSVDLQKKESGYEWMTSFQELQADYLFSKDYRLMKTTLSQPSSDAQFSCSYDNFTAFESITFPTVCSVAASMKQNQAELTFAFDKIAFNAPLHVNSINLNSYSRVGLEQILPF